MPYAKNDRLSTDEIEGGIKITDAQYQEALQAKMNGQETDTVNGELVIYSATMRTVYSTESGEELEIPENKETPEGYTDIKRPSHNHEWKKVEWVEDERKVTLEAIGQLEGQITPRRMREAMLTEEGKSWLKGIESQIETLRRQL